MYVCSYCHDAKSAVILTEARIFLMNFLSYSSCFFYCFFAFNSFSSGTSNFQVFRISSTMTAQSRKKSFYKPNLMSHFQEIALWCWNVKIRFYSSTCFYFGRKCLRFVRSHVAKLIHRIYWFPLTFSRKLCVQSLSDIVSPLNFWTQWCLLH